MVYKQNIEITEAGITYRNRESLFIYKLASKNRPTTQVSRQSEENPNSGTQFMMALSNDLHFDITLHPSHLERKILAWIQLSF